MLTPNTIGLSKLMRKTLISTLMVAVVGLASASMGGGGKKEKNKVNANFTPIRTTSGFTLKTGPSLMGNYSLGTIKTPNYVSFNTLVTYQKGNSIYIMPYHYKLNTSMYLDNSNSNNLRLLDLKISVGNRR
jgi:hypothetical protein